MSNNWKKTEAFPVNKRKDTLVLDLSIVVESHSLRQLIIKFFYDCLFLIYMDH